MAESEVEREKREQMLRMYKAMKEALDIISDISTTNMSAAAPSVMSGWSSTQGGTSSTWLNQPRTTPTPSSGINWLNDASLIDLKSTSTPAVASSSNSWQTTKIQPVPSGVNSHYETNG